MAATPASSADAPPRSTLYRRGRVRSSADPFATALLVVGGEVAWVGGEPAADALTADIVVDLDDAWVAPAFVDAHAHTTATGLALTSLDLSGARSVAEVLRAVERAGRAGRGRPVLGFGWEHDGWPEGRPPTARELDRASAGGVVLLTRADCHSGVASSALLAAAPQARDEPGWDPGGWAREQAHAVLRAAALAGVSSAQRRDAQRAVREHAAGLGIACLHECGGPGIEGEDDFAGVLRLARDEPGPEVVGYWGELDGVERAVALGAVGAAGDLFADGSLGSRTACLSEPYRDEPTTGSGTGWAYVDAAAVARHVTACTLAGLQAGFHAIGDAAVQTVLDGVAAAAQEVGEPALRAARHRLEHVEVVTPSQVAALAHFGLVASVQPAFDARWGGEHGMYAARLGTERALATNPFAALTAAGVPLALGSDAPVTPLDPWGGVRAAVLHHAPASRLSARAAFSAATRGGWRAARDDSTGDLVPGAPATFAVWQVPGELVVQVPDERVAGWSTDPRAGVSGLPDLSGPDPACLATVVRGRPVADAGGLHPAASS